ncbi:hypothetical protein SERLA73DRAFT_184303 [Serpula lacrymans var. lacrymans S7.3]|uniref:Transmembrane protein n=1 Tax=Serpula lacrymans var. lacrymans (strain S7.3) TaxID=936435 RepID=F8Q2Z4_SERL3|nr:hypothetical protein SERLA73DRAFT_184303 [Serpula lacrymans var. lacrymans S7.3]
MTFQSHYPEQLPLIFYTAPAAASIDNDRTIIMAPSCISSQPASLSKMDLYTDEKHPTSTSPSNCECANSASHRTCHKSRLRRILVPALLSLLAVTALFFVACVSDFDVWGVLGMGSGGPLAKRQSSTNQSSFTQNKLYLIVVFVGLFLVLIAGIMLSAWCCRGAFQNPLCCPCYLCACCGGLACLECIGCGLCAVGVDEML